MKSCTYPIKPRAVKSTLSIIAFAIYTLLPNTSNANDQHLSATPGHAVQKPVYNLPAGLSQEEWQEIQQLIRSRTSSFNKIDKEFLSPFISSSELRVVGADDVLAQTNYLKVFNAGPTDRVGESVAISGDYLVIGAPNEDSDGIDANAASNDNLLNSGAAYVFHRINGTWQSEAFLKAPNLGSGDVFGASVAISGNTIAIGAPEEDGGNPGVNPINSNFSFGSGAVYIYILVGNSWQFQATLKASNPGSSDRFGSSIGLDGDTLIVGAAGEDSSGAGVNPVDDNLLTDSGSAYIFIRNGTTWSQQAHLKASNPDIGDMFAESVAISGDTAAVSALVEDSNSNVINGDQSNNAAQNSGAVYVFHRTGVTWIQQAYIKAPNAQSFDLFGDSVALSGDFLLVGATGEDSNATGVNGSLIFDAALSSGAAYLFERSPVDDWLFRDYIKASNTGSNDSFGNNVAISEPYILIGASREDSSGNGVNSINNDNNPDAGAAYLYEIGQGANPTQFLAYIKASNSEAIDLFGSSVAIDGDNLVIGALFEDGDPNHPDGGQGNNDLADSGAAYVFAGASSFLQLGGSVSGLGVGNSFELISDAGEILPITGNGSFTFTNRYLTGESYTVSLATAPNNPIQDCTILNDSGTFASSDVSNILVECQMRTLSIPRNSVTVNQREVSVPVLLNTNGAAIASVVFSLDYDESCLNPDADNDGVLDQVSFNLPGGVLTSIQFNPADVDGEIDITIADVSPPIAALLDGELVRIGFTPDCAVTAGEFRVDSEIKFSTSPAPSFGDVAGQDLPGNAADGLVAIFIGIAGDCNASGSVGAADLTAIGIEIFDGDGDFFLDAVSGDFQGSPTGCDANSTEQITAADVTCTSLLSFGGTCEPLRNNQTATNVQLNTRVDVEQDRLWLRVALDSPQSPVAALAFSLELDQSQFDLSQFDLNHDGIPDLINYPQAQPAFSIVNWHADGQTGVINVLLADLANNDLAQGLLLEVGIPTTRVPKGGLSYADEPAPSFSNPNGADLQGLVSIGDVIFSDQFESR